MLRGLREMLRAGPEVQIQARLKQREKPTIKAKEWSNGIREEEITKVNLHIFNFFITEGHYDLAKSFAQQAKLNVTILDEKSIEQRSLIKNLIRNNQIDEAIIKIEEFGLTKKDEDKQTELIFSLKCLKVVELIKQQKIEDAIQTAKTQLIPYVKKKFEWMEIVERVMSLIAFVDVKECQNYELTTNHYKNKIADDVNSYLLQNNSYESLKILINLGKWCQKKLEAYVNFPHLNPWGNDIYQP